MIGKNLRNVIYNYKASVDPFPILDRGYLEMLTEISGEVEASVYTYLSFVRTSIEYPIKE